MVSIRAEVYEDSEGVKRLRYFDRERLDRYKAKLPVGARLAVSFERWQTFRSGRQSRLFHALVHRLARAQKEPFERLRTQLKVDTGNWIPATHILDGRVAMPGWKGEFVDLREVRGGINAEIVFLKSEADYTTAEESDLIERAIIACDEVSADIDDIRQDIAEARKRKWPGV